MSRGSRGGPIRGGVLAAAGLFLLVGAAPAAAQAGDRCFLLCTPELTVAPSLTIENLFGGPRVQDLQTGEVAREQTVEVFELFVALDIPTTIPRFELTFEAIWTPFAGASTNPFTGRTAEELGEQEIDENPVELELEFKFYLLESEETGGWVDAHFDVVDQLSPAEQPEDRRWYTHKLNLELDVAVAALRWLPDGNWLRNLEAEASLDYLATGMPEAGDVFGDERFVEDASPWALTFSAIIPVAPLRP